MHPGLRAAGLTAALLLVLGVAVGGLTVGAAHAQEIGRAKVSYSADLELKTNGMPLRGKVWHTPTHDRREVFLMSHSSVMIADWNTKQAWRLHPASESYEELPFGHVAQGPGSIPEGATYVRKKVGSEEINGLPTTKFKITGERKDGAPFEGFMWVSNQGIVMKMSSGEKGGGSFSMELKNVRIGSQNPALFAVPAGWKKLASSGKVNAPSATLFGEQAVAKKPNAALDAEQAMGEAEDAILESLNSEASHIELSGVPLEKLEDMRELMERVQELARRRGR